MASRVFECLRQLGKARVEISGSFLPQGTGAIAAANWYGNGFTVARTGVGVYTVTFADPYFGYDAAWADLESPTLGQAVQIIQEPDVRVTKTLVVAAFATSSGAATELGPNANTRVHFGIRIKNTSGNW